MNTGVSANALELCTGLLSSTCLSHPIQYVTEERLSSRENLDMLSKGLAKLSTPQSSLALYHSLALCQKM